MAWIEQDKEPDIFRAYERDELLQEIYGRLGDSGKAADLAWKPGI